jgi:glycyl-tRNA synthetase beta chain
MNTENLLLELGTEELPPKALKTLGIAFRDGITAGFDQRQLSYGEVRWYATPRRLAVLVCDLQLRAADREVELLGPPADRARDAAGEWTAAALGFARKQGLAQTELQIMETPRGPRLGVRRTEPGLTVKECLNTVIEHSISQLPIPKRMRWGASRVEFVRPVHWVVAMLGQDSDHGEILGQPTGSKSRGHRFHSPGVITITRPEEYADTLGAAKVVACFDQRREMIRDQLEVEASALKAHAVIDEDLLDEVTGLVEWPVALTGAFEERFLAVPAEALISSMKEHQKYFHLIDDAGRLLPNFITICNIESTDPIQVIQGNERVIRPRLADAAFFYETDKKTPLEARVAKLDAIVFQQKLGSLGDKTRRMVQLAGGLADLIDAPVALAERAALLSKADLVTDMVQEFSDMQGIAGYHYALNDGEDDEVALALAQQYWPKFAGDRLPESATACALGLADRLDTLVGIFGIGQPPTGSRDPFALRRASLAVLRILVEKEIDLDLRECLELAVGLFPPDRIEAGTVEKVLAYMLERFRAWYEEEQIAAEVFRAVSANKPSRPLDINRRVHAVNAFSRLPEAAALAAANKRVANILDKLENTHRFSEVSADLLQEPAEKALAQKLAALTASCGKLLADEAYTEALTSLASLRDPVDNFFDTVMVNAEDPALRANRLNLVRALRELFLRVADISQLAGSR